MSTNLSPLMHNWCASLKTEIGRKAMLWAAETRDTTNMKYRAAEYGDEVDQLVCSLGPMLSAGMQAHADLLTERDVGAEEVIDDLLHFILTRHANFFWGANVKLPFGVTA